MGGEFKKSIKLFLKEVKKFKKVSKKDSKEGVRMANELIVKCDELGASKFFDNKLKEHNELIKMKDILKLYIDNITKLEDIGVKYK